MVAYFEKEAVKSLIKHADIPHDIDDKKEYLCNLIKKSKLNYRAFGSNDWIFISGPSDWYRPLSSCHRGEYVFQCEFCELKVYLYSKNDIYNYSYCPICGCINTYTPDFDEDCEDY